MACTTDRRLASKRSFFGRDEGASSDQGDHQQYDPHDNASHSATARRPSADLRVDILVGPVIERIASWTRRGTIPSLLGAMSPTRRSARRRPFPIAIRPIVLIRPRGVI